MKAGRKRLPETCPYLDDWQWISIRMSRGMSQDDVVQAWKQRRDAAREAGYSPQKTRPKQRLAAWLNSGVDNPFAAEHVFQLRLGLALRGKR